MASYFDDQRPCKFCGESLDPLQRCSCAPALTAFYRRRTSLTEAEIAERVAREANPVVASR